MQGVAGEWAVAFHGINCPADIVPAKNKTVIESIMDGKDRGEMLIAGSAQAYQYDIAVNRKEGELVGRGIYCSPHFTVGLF